MCTYNMGYLSAIAEKKLVVRCRFVHKLRACIHPKKHAKESRIEPQRIFRTRLAARVCRGRVWLVGQEGKTRRGDIDYTSRILQDAVYLLVCASVVV